MWRSRLDPDVRDLADEVVALRRDFHRHPELAFQEFRTSDVIARYLETHGYEVRRNVAVTGVVATLATGRPGPTVMIRADMDALPIAEPPGVSFASTVDGVMHACGHDGHVAMALGLARLLRGGSELRGNVKFVFQPAEEGPGGAERMLEARVLADPAVDYVLVAHLQNDLPVGTVAVRPGPALASSDHVTIRVRGRAAHGAKPHLGVDAIVVAAQVVVALQTFVSREVSPLDTAVLTLGTIAGGRSWNVIADEIVITGTVRTLDAAVRARARASIERIVGGLGAALGAGCELTWKPMYAVTVNDPEVAALVARAAAAAVGDERVTPYQPLMVSDDASAFLERARGAYFFVGSANSERGLAGPSHSPEFAFDEDALLVGVQVLKNVVRAMLAAEGRLPR